jgi:hypothetical protein
VRFMGLEEGVVLLVAQLVADDKNKCVALMCGFTNVSEISRLEIGGIGRCCGLCF